MSHLNTNVSFVPRPKRQYGLSRMNEIKPTKLTNAPDGFEYYRVCDQEGVCHVVRGMQAVRRRIEEMPELTVTKLPSHWRAEPAA